MSKEDLLYSSDHPRVVNELKRLQHRAKQSKEAKQNTKEAPRWMTTHKQLAADCFLTYLLYVVIQKN